MTNKKSKPNGLEKNTLYQYFNSLMRKPKVLSPSILKYIIKELILIKKIQVD